MRIFAILAFMAGLGVVTLLVGRYGVGAVGSALVAVGSVGFLAILCLHLVVIVCCGIAWWILVPIAGRAAPRSFVWGRLVRDAGSEVLPLSQLGGYMLGARATVLAGVRGAMAAASTVVDVTTELLGQITYSALGLGVLSMLRPETGMILPFGLGLAAALIITAAFIAAQHYGFGLLERASGRLARRWARAFATSAAAVQRAVHGIYRRPAALLTSYLVHLACWIVAAAEPWLALKFMGFPLGFGPVLAIESLLYAARSVAFAIPNALGVQEAAYIVLCGIFGIGPDSALALSLLKRGRDLCLGLPVLLAWQFIEARRAWRSPPRSAGGT
jgi:glycosyltransferase 2 family protein